MRARARARRDRRRSSLAADAAARLSAEPVAHEAQYERASPSRARRAFVLAGLYGYGVEELLRKGLAGFVSTHSVPPVHANSRCLTLPQAAEFVRLATQDSTLLSTMRFVIVDGSLTWEGDNYQGRSTRGVLAGLRRAR